MAFNSKKNTMTGRRRDHGRKESALRFSFNDTFPWFFKQWGPTFPSALVPVNYEADPFYHGIPSTQLRVDTQLLLNKTLYPILFWG